MNAEIQIQFPTPGEWGEFILTAIYKDADGYTRTDRYTQDDIPVDQAPSYGCVLRMESPTILNGIGNNTYVKYGLTPYQRSWIISEIEAPYADPEQPTA